MTIVKTERFKKEFAALPPNIQERATKQFELFLNNPRHPSVSVEQWQESVGFLRRQAAGLIHRAALATLLLLSSKEKLRNGLKRHGVLWQNLKKILLIHQAL